MLENLVVPNKLEKGDKVALVTSSWAGPSVFPWKYNFGKKQLSENFGVTPVEMDNTLATESDLSISPQKRAKDLMDAFEDPSIKGIIATIGGDDSIRMLPYIDFDVIRNNPKIFLGYSDSTITHFICLKAGLRTYYGPSIMSGFAENGGLLAYMKESVQKTLFTNLEIGIIPENKEGWTAEQLSWKDESLLDQKRSLHPPMDRKVLQGAGIVKGRLIGGCMDVLEFIKGTDIWPSKEVWEGSVLFLETSEDCPTEDQIQYWLRNYAAQGILNVINAIILARPGGGYSPEYYEKVEKSFLKIIKDECDLDIPILSRLDFGHTDPQIILPYGALVEIDLDKKALKVIDKGVI